MFAKRAEKLTSTKKKKRKDEKPAVKASKRTKLYRKYTTTMRKRAGAHIKNRAKISKKRKRFGEMGGVGESAQKGYQKLRRQKKKEKAAKEM